MLGTLAAQERQDPVVVVSGDRDLLQVVADDPVPVRVLYLGRGLTKATLFGPAEVAEHYGVPVDRAGAGLRRARAAARRPVRRPAGRAGRRREDRRDAARCSTARWSRSWPPPTTRNRKMAKGLRAKLLAAADYIEAAAPVVRVATDAPVTLSTPTDALPLVAADPRTHRRAGDPAGRRVVDRAPAESAGRAARADDALLLGRPTS